MTTAPFSRLRYRRSFLLASGGFLCLATIAVQQGATTTAFSSTRTTSRRKRCEPTHHLSASFVSNPSPSSVNPDSSGTSSYRRRRRRGHSTQSRGPPHSPQDDAILATCDNIERVLEAARRTLHPTTLSYRRRRALYAVLRLVQSNNDGDEQQEELLDLLYLLWQKRWSEPTLHQHEDSRRLQSDFHAVLRAFCKSQRHTDRAHLLVACWERRGYTATAVTYSILLSSTGVTRKQVDDWWHTAVRHVKVDTVLCNTAMDAYLRVKRLDCALDIFNDMQTTACVPNVRSYNTILKGMAATCLPSSESGAWSECQEWARTMKELQVWDAVSTNTLAQAAIQSDRLVEARSILDHETVQPKRQDIEHPNVPAYSKLVDALAKRGEMERAEELVQTMRQRQVVPNMFTYTSLLVGYIRAGRDANVRQLWAALHANDDQRPQAVTYNAWLTALPPDRAHMALEVFREMMQRRVRPNVNTVALLVEQLGRASPQPRLLSAAKLLIDKLEGEGVIPTGSTVVMTAAVVAWGQKAGDVPMAHSFFKRISKPDTAAECHDGRLQKRP